MQRAFARYVTAGILMLGTVNFGHSEAQQWTDCIQSQDSQRKIASCSEILQQKSSWTDAQRTAAYIERGNALYKSQQIDRAIEDYSAAIHLDPKNWAAFVNRGNAHLVKKDTSGAIADYDQAIRLNPTSPQAFENRAAAYSTRGNHDLSIADYSTAIKLDANNARLFEERAEAYRSQRAYEKSILDYMEAVRLDPKNSRLLETCIDAIELNNDHKQAIADYTKLISLAPKVSRLFQERGWMNYLEDHYDLAVSDYTEAIRLNPADADLFAKRAVAYRAKNDYVHAISDYSDAIRLDSGPDRFAERAEAYAANNDHEHAIADYGEAIRLDPNPDRFDQRAEVYAAKRDHDHEIADYTEAIRLDPSPDRFEKRAKAHLNKDEFDLAIADYTQAIRLDPTNPERLYSRAAVYESKGDHTRAIADYTEAIRLNPTDPHRLAKRAEAHAAAGADALAVADYAEAIRLDPKDETFLQSRAALYVKLKQFDRALADYDRLSALDPKNIKAFVGRGKLYFAKGDLEKAVREYESASRIDPDSELDGKREVLNTRAAFTFCTEPSPKEDGIPARAPIVTINICTEYIGQHLSDPIANAKAFTSRAVAYKFDGQFALALADADQSFKLDPKNTIPMILRGDINLESGAFDQAIESYSKTLRVDPGRLDALVWRGIALGLIGNLDGALKDFRGDYPGYLGEFLQRYVRGWLTGFAYLRKHENARAIKEFTEFLVRPDPWILTERGRLYLDQGSYDLAIADFTAAVGISKGADYFAQFTPNHEEAFQGRAAAYERKGDLVKAKLDREAAVRHRPHTAGEYRGRAVVKLARGDYEGAESDAAHAAQLDGFAWHWTQNIAKAMLSRQGIVPGAVAKQVPAAAPAPIVVPILGETIGDIQKGQSVKLNGHVREIVKVDSATRTITLSANRESLLPGLNILESAAGWLTFWNEGRNLAPFEQPYHHSFAIIAAIDRYDRVGGNFPRLDGMVSRAKELREALIAVGFPPANIRTYYDDEATSTNLNNALKEFWRGGGRVKQADRLFFYFGGHGAEDDGKGYLVTFDFNLTEPLFTSFLMSDIVDRHFQYLNAHHVLVALDSCSAGLAVPGSRSLTAGVDDSQLANFRKLALIRADTEPKARNLIVAGTGDQRALWDTGGIFTKALIDGLRGAADRNGDGLVQFDELTSYLRQRVIPEAALRRVRQEPKEFRATYFGDGKVLFLLPRK